MRSRALLVRAVAPAVVCAGLLALAVASAAVASAAGAGTPGTAVGDDARVADGDHPVGTGPFDRVVLPTGLDPGSNVTGTSSAPRFEVIHPNPVADGDSGESVVLRFPGSTDGTGWTLVDEAGHTATLPNGTLSGRIVLSPQAGVAEGAFDAPVRPLGGRLRLANGGDALALRRPNGSVVDRVAYDDAPEGEHYRRVDGETWRWRPQGSTSLDPLSTTPTSATAFVLPDAPGVIVDELRDADRRILLAGYTFSSHRIVEAVLDARERGVEVRVLLEGAPVGGVSTRQADALDRLARAGIPVTVFAGDRDPFRYHHAKYAVVDDRAIVVSENWKPSGTGGHSNRGWGAVVHGPELARELAGLYETDRTGPGTESWASYRATVDAVDYGAATERYPRHFAPASVPVEGARLLVAPDNARRELAELIRSANESVAVHQVGIDGTDDPLLRAAIDAARNGTGVEILLSSASYTASENRALVATLDALADREDIPLAASLASPRGRFDATHVKGVIVDERHVVVGSLNWNPTAYGENREVLVVLTGAAVAGYYAEVFRADARSRTIWQVPVGLVAIVVVAWIGLGVVASTRIRFRRR